MYPILFKFGPITIYTYGVMIALGIVIGLWYVIRMSKAGGIDSDKIITLYFWSIVVGFVGARGAYVFTELDYFLQSPHKVLLSNSGFVFYGGFIAVFLITPWYVRKNKLPLWKTADIFAPSLVMAQALGRIGCFLYGCCYGKPTRSWIGIVFPHQSPAGEFGFPVIPTQLISAIALGIIFFILIFVNKHKKFDGQIFWLYVFLYALMRFSIEFFRGDPRGNIWIFSTSGAIAIVMLLVSLIMYWKIKNAQKKL